MCWSRPWLIPWRTEARKKQGLWSSRSHSRPKKRECSHPRTEVAEGGRAVSEVTEGLQLCKRWPELALTAVRIVPLPVPSWFMLRSPTSCLCLRHFLGTGLGLTGKQSAWHLSPALWRWVFSQGALVLPPPAADLGTVEPSITHPKDLFPPPLG